MKYLKQFSATLSTILILFPFILVVSYFFIRNVDLVELAVMWLVPGFLFTLIIGLTKKKNETPINEFMIFIVAASVLYIGVFFLSAYLYVFGVFTIPSVGAYFLMKLMQRTISPDLNKKLFLYSWFSAPISGGIVLFFYLQFGEFPLISVLPIMVWCFYMAVIIDLATRKENNV